MAQPSIACYFNTRKRTAVEDLKLNNVKRQLILEKDVTPKISSRTANIIKNHIKNEKEQLEEKIVKPKECLTPKSTTKKVGRPAKPKKIDDNKQKNLTEMLDKLKERHVTPPREIESEKSSEKKTENKSDFDKIKEKLSKSSRLAELKASIKRFNESNDKLKQAEEKTALILSPKIKSFKTIEIEVPVSPQKVQSPEKPYLSPRKDVSTVRKNLLNCLSPTKNAVALLPESPSKKIQENVGKLSLKLPFKYRYLIEIFEGIDTVAQILFNRKETITFKKLKPGVEKLLKRNLTEKHIAQIKSIYPEAYELSMEKLRVFGMGSKREEWELVIKPKIQHNDKMNEQVILERKRNLYNNLLSLVKDYHSEFLQSLIPPMIIPKDKITRWHPEFDIEKVPDIEAADVPQPPAEENLTGQQVLEKARQLFNCNTKMEKALARLQANKETNPVQETPTTKPESILKGIPQGLLEKVRQRQAAKALAAMTRSDDKDKEILLYSRLPEIARLTRNIFVSEKKSVLMMDVVVEKLKNCYPVSLKNNELEELLRTIAKEVPGWIVFHNIRNTIYVKLAKDADLSIVISKLESLAKEKNDA